MFAMMFPINTKPCAAAWAAASRAFPSDLNN